MLYFGHTLAGEFGTQFAAFTCVNSIESQHASVSSCWELNVCVGSTVVVIALEVRKEVCFAYTANLELPCHLQQMSGWQLPGR